MDDAQSPPDADNAKGDRARRALRLRDAESVAAMRRDMFGDGSLLDILGGSPPVPEDAGSPADATPSPHEGSPLVALDGSTAAPEDTEPSADPAAAPQSEAALPQEPGPDETQSDPVPDRIPVGSMMAAPLADVPHSLDAIIDSFAAEAVTDGLDRPDQGKPGPTFLAPLLFSPRSLASDPGDQPSDEPPSPAPAPMQVSAIFNGLDAAEGAAREAGLDESAHTPAAFDAPVPAALPEQDDAQQAEAQPWEGIAESRDPIEAIAEDGTFAAEAMQPLSEAQDDSRHPIEDGAPEDGPPAAAGAETSWEALADSRQEPEPPVPVMRSFFPAFPELPAMPSFPEPVQEAAAPPVPEPLRAAVAPPFPAPAEATAPPFPDPERWSFRPAPVPRYPEPLERPPFREARGAAAFPQIEPPSPRHVLDAAAKVSDEATARIAAEATATAEALENLNRMLGHNVPEPRVAAPGWPAGDAQQHSMRVDPAPFLASPAPDLPLPVPPPEPSRAKGIYLLGFLTGLGLSLMAGVALYFLINTV